MTPTARAPHQRDPSRGWWELIPRRALVASLPFSTTLGAEEVAAAITEGLRAGGGAEPDVLVLSAGRRRPLEVRGAAPRTPGGPLELAGFDERLRRAKALIVASGRLERAHLRATPEFEILTRARQAGVPAYAICGDARLDAFDARLLDLQVVIEARTARALNAAARRLAPLL